MARLFKPTITRYVDLNGRRCKKGDAGARKKRVKSKTWRGEFRDADGVPQSVTLRTNKEAARHMLHELETKAMHGRAGMIDPFEEHHRRPLSEHLTDFMRHLESKNNSVKHVRQTLARIQAVFNGCKFSRFRDLSASQLSQWLAG